jgi:hypothetical protein
LNLFEYFAWFAVNILSMTNVQVQKHKQNVSWLNADAMKIKTRIYNREILEKRERRKSDFAI